MSTRKGCAFRSRSAAAARREKASPSPFGPWTRCGARSAPLRLREVESFFLYPSALPALGAHTLDSTFGADEGLGAACERLANDAVEAVRAGAELLLLTDEQAGPERAPLPAVLAVGAVHARLVASTLRTRASILVVSDEPREPHGFACLLGYGASAVNPYLLLETLPEMVESGEFPDGMGVEEATANVVAGIGKGLLKVLSKMGISTLQSYRGAQIFEAVGLDTELVRRYFTGTASRVSGVGLDVIAEEVRLRHAAAFPDRAPGEPDLSWGGEYQWRRDGDIIPGATNSVYSLSPVVLSDNGAQFQCAITNAYGNTNSRDATLTVSTNGVLREVYTNITGTAVASLTNHPSFPKNPATVEVLDNFESPTGVGNNYGQRLRAFITPPSSCPSQSTG